LGSHWRFAFPATELTLGNCETALLSGTLTVTGQDGCSLALGELKIVEGAAITLNPTNVSITVGSVKRYTSYPGTSNLTLGGTSTGNVVTGNLSSLRYHLIRHRQPQVSGHPAQFHKTGGGEKLKCRSLLAEGRVCISFVGRHLANDQMGKTQEHGKSCGATEDIGRRGVP